MKLVISSRQRLDQYQCDLPVFTCHAGHLRRCRCTSQSWHRRQHFNMIKCEVRRTSGRIWIWLVAWWSNIKSASVRESLGKNPIPVKTAVRTHNQQHRYLLSPRSPIESVLLVPVVSWSCIPCRGAVGLIKGLKLLSITAASPIGWSTTVQVCRVSESPWILNHGCVSHARPASKKSPWRLGLLYSKLFRETPSRKLMTPGR